MSLYVYQHCEDIDADSNASSAVEVDAFSAVSTFNWIQICGICIGYHTDQGPQGRDQYDGQGVYCGQSTASEVFLIILYYPTIHIFSAFLYVCTM